MCATGTELSVSTNLAVTAGSRTIGSVAPGAASASIEIHDDVAAVAACWIRLEAQCLASPYQGLAWQEAFARDAVAPGARVCYAVVRDGATGTAILLLPLVVTRRGGVFVASLIGGKHANFHMPLFCAQAGAHLSPDAVRGHLIALARRLGVDVFAFSNMPRSWRDQPNPLALPGARPGANQAYWTSFADRPADGPAVPLGRDARKKLRRKREILGEIGPVSVRRARSPAEARGALAAFLAHKALRMSELGVENPFAHPGTRAFLDAVTRPDERGEAPVAVWSLCVGDRIVASFGAACDGKRASGMFIAFENSPDVARASPGDLLIQSVTEDLFADGYDSFDLGVGAARYKAQFCDRVEDVLDLTLPVTLRGRVFAASLRLRADVERWAKSTPRVLSALTLARRKLAVLKRVALTRRR